MLVIFSLVVRWVILASSMKVRLRSLQQGQLTYHVVSIFEACLIVIGIALSTIKIIVMRISETLTLTRLLVLHVPVTLVVVAIVLLNQSDVVHESHWLRLMALFERRIQYFTLLCVILASYPEAAPATLTTTPLGLNLQWIMQVVLLVMTATAHLNDVWVILAHVPTCIALFQLLQVRRRLEMWRYLHHQRIWTMLRIPWHLLVVVCWHNWKLPWLRTAIG